MIFPSQRIYIEVSDACNLDCPGCLRPRSGNSIMTIPDFRTIIEKLAVHAPQTRTLQLFWRGEPTLSPHLPELARIARTRGYWLGTSTNMSTESMHDRAYVNALLSNLNEIFCDVDGYDQRSLSRYRKGASWKVLIENLEAISKSDLQCIKRMKVLMFKWNIGHEAFYRSMARRYNMDSITFKTPIIQGKAIISHAEAMEWQSADRRYRRYKKVGENWIHLSSFRCQPTTCISVEGNVFGCPINNMADQYCLGNILKDTFAEIQHGYNQLEKRMLDRRLAICKDCTCFPSKRTAYIERLRR